MKKLLTLTAAFEALTGVALIIAPTMAVWLLLGAEPSGVGTAITRLAGIALFALGLACWPGRDAGAGATAALRAMLVYNLFAALYLAYLGIGAAWVGLLLWPAVAFHAVLTPLLATAWLKARHTLRSKP